MRMTTSHDGIAIHATATERLAIDAMVLADEIETYFGSDEVEATMALMDAPGQARVARAGLRLSRLASQLVEQLAHAPGSLVPTELTGEQSWMRDDVSALPPRARALVEATRALVDRMRDLQAVGGPTFVVPSPARALQEMLADRLNLKVASSA